MAEYMQPLGYRFFALTETGGRYEPLLEGDPAFRELNYLFVHESRLEAVAAVVPLAGQD
jgi:hypothetical protein